MEEIRRELDAVARELGDRPAVRAHLENLSRGLAYEEEVILGRELQEGLLPLQMPEVKGLDIAARLISAAGATTDLYDVFEASEGVVGFFLAEARPAGLTAAPILTLAKVMLDSARTTFHTPLAIMTEMNAELRRRRHTRDYLTAFLGLLDTRTLHLRYVNASHRAPLRFGLNAPKPLTGGGRFLGRHARPGYEEVEVQLAPGERLFFYTSGLTLAKNAQGESYGARRLRAIINERAEESPENTIDRVYKDLRRHARRRKFANDVTLLAVVLSPDILLEEQIVIRSEPDQLTRPVNAIMGRLKEMNYDERSQFAVRLCLEEALINALKHGNKMDRMKRIIVTFRIDEHEMRVSVQDEGDGFHPDAVPDPRLPENLEVSHGRGLLLMRSYMDDVLYSDNGCKVTLVKKAPWE